MTRRATRVASRYYSGRRPPSKPLSESTNSKLDDESELFRDLSRIDSTGHCRYGWPIALARTPAGQPSFPEYERILTSAAAVIVPGLVLSEVDYFLRAEGRAMPRLIAEIFDPATRYERTAASN